jgi:hypothetical protein
LLLMHFAVSLLSLKSLGFEKCSLLRLNNYRFSPQSFDALELSLPCWALLRGYYAHYSQII